MVSTLSIELTGNERNHRNRETVHVVRGRELSGSDFRNAFLIAYDRFAAACRDIDEPGIALIAVDERTGRPCGIVRLRARIGRHVVALVGRHDKCDLFLSASRSLSLRHLAVVVEPVQSFASPPRYRLFDLRTDHGFTDETGRRLRGLIAEGAAIVRCGGYILFALPIGDPTDWPARANDAWDILPERVYLDELPAVESSLRRSVVLRASGPRDTGMELADAEVTGTLEWIGVKQRALIPIGASALADGVLLGRYARCDQARLVDDAQLSRVHALLVQTRGGLLAFDTASTFGLHASGEAKRVIELPDRAELQLGRSTRVVWRRYR